MFLILSGLPKVRGNLFVEATAEGLPGGGDPEAERALPAEDAAQGGTHRAVQQGDPVRRTEAGVAGDNASEILSSVYTRGRKRS